MAILELKTDYELVGKGASHLANVKIINDNFAELAGGEGGGPSVVNWADVQGKPETFAPIIGTTATTAKAGNWVPAWADVTGKPTTFAPIVGTTATTAAAGNHTHVAATTSAPGFLSAADKTKLDGIATGATALALGTTGTTAAAGNHTHPDATITVAGLMSAADKVKLNGIAAGANNYVLPAATTGANGGVRRAATVTPLEAEADAAAIVTAFNDLLAKMTTAGQM